MKFETVTLKDLTTDGKGHYGIGASAVEPREGLYTYLRITDIRDDGTLNAEGLKCVDDPDANKYLLKQNDIVFARTGASTGRNYFYDIRDGEFVYAGFLIKFSLDPRKVNPKYIKYYCQSDLYKNWIASNNTGSTRGNINAQAFGNMPITLPSRQQQDFLVDLLAQLDDKIRLNNKINDNLEQQAQALFTAWFVKFLPFNGKAPDDWKNIPFSDFLVQSKEKSDDPNIPMYSVTDTGIFPRSEKFKKVLSMTRAKNKVIRQTDLVFGMSREILNWGIMRDPEGGVSSAYNVYHVDRSINSFYLESYIKSNISLFKDLIKPASREGQGIDKAALMQKTLLLPAKEILDKYYELENVYTNIMKQLQAENKTLTEIRDELLPKLMSGEIDVE